MTFDRWKDLRQDKKRKIVRGNCIFILAILFIVTAGIKCDNHKVTDGYEPRFVAGTVMDSLIMAPIEGARISHDSLLEQSLAVSDSGGHYIAFSGAPDSNIALFCGKSDYRTKRAIYSTVFQETTLVDFELLPE